MAEIILTEQNRAADPTRGHFWPTDESLILQFCLEFIANPRHTVSPVSVFSHLYDPPTPKYPSQRHCGPHPLWTEATPGARQAIKTGLPRVLCFVQWRLVLLSRELGSLTKVASFCKVECHRKDCDCTGNAWAVCLPLARGPSEGPAARLPGASSNCLHTEFSTHLKTCRPALSFLLKSESSCDLFPTWLLWNWQFYSLEKFYFTRPDEASRTSGSLWPSSPCTFICIY